MNGGVLALVMAALVGIGAGAYVYFVAGEQTGIVLMAAGGAMAALAGAAGSRNKQKDDSDAR